MLAQPIRRHFCSSCFRPFWLNISKAMLAQHIRSNSGSPSTWPFCLKVKLGIYNRRYVGSKPCWLNLFVDIWARPIRSRFGSSCVRPFLAQPICSHLGSRPFGLNISVAMLAQHIRSHPGSTPCWLNISVATLAQHIRRHLGSRENLGCVYTYIHTSGRPQPGRGL